MKKVRFETPTKLVMDSIQNYECHSPRPFIERQIVQIDCNINQPKPLVFTNDPVQMFENSDSSPYPTVNKTHLNSISKLPDRKLPSSELDLSILDVSQPRHVPSFPKSTDLFRTAMQSEASAMNALTNAQVSSGVQTPDRILTSIENRNVLHPPNILTKENDFFLRRDNLGKLSYTTLNQQFNQISLNKQDNSLVQKSKLLKLPESKLFDKENFAPTRVEVHEHCKCHDCIKLLGNVEHNNIAKNQQCRPCERGEIVRNNCHPHKCMTPPHIQLCKCNMQIIQSTCQCNKHHSPPMVPQNAVDKKTWAIEKYEKSQKGENLEVEKQANVCKEKREPTVADLIKIIKLQNEQLQLLQEKVDRFISAHNHNIQEKQKLPIQNFVTEHMAVQTVNSEEHKISIGVMTSFEMVRTSTVINKEVMKQCESQIQCNRSQISIKEVISKKQAGNLNFLDGIPPVSKNVEIDDINAGNCANMNTCEDYRRETVMEDKTLNELSLYNVQVDNATTPLMSPDQSLYLDVRDYSESDSGSDDQSNVGWTYYNKVMTHVNGMLQDSDMPSSASALYRQTKEKYVQIDKSNVSAAKRVTFGDVPLGIQQQQAATPTDTSLKMNQLAAKYLKNVPYSHTPSPRAAEMSFATKNYMERHKLLQGQQFGQNSPHNADIPRFLDITALKQQPKFI